MHTSIVYSTDKDSQQLPYYFGSNNEPDYLCVAIPDDDEHRGSSITIQGPRAKIIRMAQELLTLALTPPR